MSISRASFVEMMTDMNESSLTRSRVFVLSNIPRRGHHIGYEDCRKKQDDVASTGSSAAAVAPTSSEETPVLLLNGFGVGTFHQHRLMPKLIDGSDGKRIVYGIDYLGQGRSWPIDCDDGESESERGLRYCINTWADQIIEFIEEVILPEHTSSKKIHLVGNSVGGYLSVVLASKRPDLIDSISLLNATPVWGLNAPGWSGVLPAPFLPKSIGRYLFDRIRDFKTIEKFLGETYSNRLAFDDDLMKRIRGMTEGPGGHAAFASILWSPPAEFDAEGSTDFYGSLENLDCDCLLVFGKDDPWCKPAFAKRMCECLGKRSDHVHRYVEVENAGHCPNHEAPTATAAIVNRWLAADEGARGVIKLVEGNTEEFKEKWGMNYIREIGADEISILSAFDRIITKFV